MPTIQTNTLGELFAAAGPPAPLRELAIVAVKTEIDPVKSPALRDHWLSPLERDIPAPWKSAARRRHWFAGRIAARVAAQIFGWELKPDSITVTAHASGAPFLTSPVGVLDCTITHSGNWAIACICPEGWQLGLDFEVGADERVHLAKRVCSRSQRTFHQLDVVENRQAVQGTFGTIWTLKEALLKAWRVGLVSDLDAILIGALPSRFDGQASIRLAKSISRGIPHPLPEESWNAITRWADAPLACVAVQRE